MPHGKHPNRPYGFEPSAKFLLKGLLVKPGDLKSFGDHRRNLPLNLLKASTIS